MRCCARCWTGCGPRGAARSIPASTSIWPISGRCAPISSTITKPSSPPSSAAMTTRREEPWRGICSSSPTPRWRPGNRPPQFHCPGTPRLRPLFPFRPCFWHRPTSLCRAVRDSFGSDRIRSFPMRLAALAAAFVLVAAPAAVQAQDATPLVDAEWLKAHAGDDNLVILDIRDNIEGADLGELPYIANAVVAPYASAGWRVEVEGVPAQIPPAEQIAGLIGGLGIDGDDHV